MVMIVFIFFSAGCSCVEAARLEVAFEAALLSLSIFSNNTVLHVVDEK